MTTKSQVNSGFRKIAVTDVNGNVIGATVQQLQVAGPANITIGGGSPGGSLSTDGAGNLSWVNIPGIIANAQYLVNGNSNVSVAPSGPITFSVAGVANVAYVTANTITNSANLGNISNVVLAGGNVTNYIQTDGAGNLSWAPDQYIIPDSGYGPGRTLARGNKLWATGSGTSAYALNDATPCTRNTRNKNILYDNLPGTVPALTSFTKIYDSELAIYALGNNGIFYTCGQSRPLGLYSDISQRAWDLTPLTNSAVYGPGITVENFWAPDEYLYTNGEGHCILQIMDNGTRKYYAWGYNNYGSLGIGNTLHQNLPVEITVLRGKNLVSVSTNTFNTMVVTDTGEVWGTGLNGYGQLGVGTTTNSDVFVRATLQAGSALITDAVEVQVSILYTTTYIFTAFIRRSNGTVVAAGNGSNNRLGSGSTANQSRFVPVLTAAGTPITNIVKIVARGSDAMALDSAGNLYAWGVNNGFWGNGEASGTTSVYAKVVQTNVSNFWLMTRVNGFGKAMIHTRTNGVTYGAGSNNSYALGVEPGTIGTGVFLTATPIYFCERDEYALKIKPIGADTTLATLILTNRNRVYVCGSTDEDAGAWGYTPTSTVPIPITDIDYY